MGTQSTASEAPAEAASDAPTGSPRQPRPTLPDGFGELDRRAIDTVRVLAMDAVQKVGNAHPGTAMSLAPAAYLIYQKLMRHDPTDPGWPARDRFVRASYALQDLMSFLTAGEDEVRAWTIRRGDTALTAAGKIHSDIARGFIRAEVTPYEDFIRLGSEARCREAGKLRLEGKDYVVRDGDIIHFRFNV